MQLPWSESNEDVAFTYGTRALHTKALIVIISFAGVSSPTNDIKVLLELRSKNIRVTPLTHFSPVSHFHAPLKVEKLYWYAGYDQSQQKKTKNDGMLYSFFKLERMHINLIFLLLTFNMYLSVGDRKKSTIQLKCTLKNRVVSLKHVPVTWVKQHIV